MNLRIRRFAHLPECTIGAFYIDGRFDAFTLEDEGRVIKVAGETRIPAGTYKVTLQTAGRLHEKYKGKFPEHRGMLLLNDVPGFTGIMLHVGNKDADTDGCPLLGDIAMSAGELANSTGAYRRVYGQVSNAILAGEPVSITVED